MTRSAFFITSREIDVFREAMSALAVSSAVRTARRSSGRFPDRFAERLEATSRLWAWCGHP